MAQLTGQVGAQDIPADVMVTATGRNGELYQWVEGDQRCCISGELLPTGSYVVLDANDPNGRWRIA